ncbi:EamA-like transporter family protein [Stella humosa]|uniref:EamA-like transporter family protein n=2 Tax=Stella humosa TaxID=94 RepID=A0A3N1MLE9_9PROT|nr:DMT family transporter [Stella humosa]ROQ01816.1 EamA-like transporter family protein [Stella humosa]
MGQGGRGIILVTAAAVVFSAAGPFTRLIVLDAWTVVFWRGTFGGLFILAWIAWTHRARTLSAFGGMGRAGLAAAACSALGTVCFINALQRSTVADVTLIHAAAPFVTAAIGWLLLGRRESTTTLAAAAVAMSGVVVIFGGAPAGGQFVGNLLALAMTVLIGTMMVIIRANPGRSMLPAASLSGFASAVLVAPFAQPLSPTIGELAMLAAFGAQFGLGLLLLTLGTRLVSATRSALIGSLEIPLGPVAVWLAFAERPAAASYAGGAVVVAAVLADILFGRRRRRSGLN